MVWIPGYNNSRSPRLKSFKLQTNFSCPVPHIFSCPHIFSNQNCHKEKNSWLYKIIWKLHCQHDDNLGSRKKNIFLMAGPLRSYPPPLELNGHRNFFFGKYWNKQVKMYSCKSVRLYSCISDRLFSCIYVRLYSCISVSLYSCISVRLYSCKNTYQQTLTWYVHISISCLK